MLDGLNISSTEIASLGRRIPWGFGDLDLNFRCNAVCDRYGLHPDPLKRPTGTLPAPSGILQAVVAGKKHDEFSKCPARTKISWIKNNRATGEDYRRLKRL